MEALLDADPTQISAFLVLAPGERGDGERDGGVGASDAVESGEVDAGDDVLDIVGTGGDDAGTVNISTGSCVLAAAAGAKVAKHGSRDRCLRCAVRVTCSRRSAWRLSWDRRA